MRNGDGVRRERSGWRDQALSERHREWGFNCPAVDCDFLMCEFNFGLPVALVEYKHHTVPMPDLRHPSYRAQRALCDGYKDGPRPFLLAFYWPGVWAFRVYPINAAAGVHFREREELSEREYVERLYALRGLAVEAHVLPRLQTVRPAAAGAPGPVDLLSWGDAWRTD